MKATLTRLWESAVAGGGGVSIISKEFLVLLSIYCYRNFGTLLRICYCRYLGIAHSTTEHNDITTMITMMASCVTTQEKIQ